MLPTDDGGTSVPAVQGAALARAEAKKILQAIVGSATDLLGAGVSFKVALCGSAPDLNIVDGSWSLTGHELTTGTAPGYGRAAISRSAGFDAPAGAATVASSSNLEVLFPTATADWPPVTHVAILSHDGTRVLSVYELAQGLLVRSGRKARIPVAGLRLTLVTT